MADGVKIGFLNDMAAAGPAPGDDMIAWIEREIAAVRKAGRFDGDVEIVHAMALACHRALARQSSAPSPSWPRPMSR
jgi:hypothetical protein